jgi:hypothetical protein
MSDGEARVHLQHRAEGYLLRLEIARDIVEDLVSGRGSSVSGVLAESDEVAFPPLPPGDDPELHKIVRWQLELMRDEGEPTADEEIGGEG